MGDLHRARRPRAGRRPQGGEEERRAGQGRAVPDVHGHHQDLLRRPRQRLALQGQPIRPDLGHAGRRPGVEELGRLGRGEACRATGRVPALPRQGPLPRLLHPLPRREAADPAPGRVPAPGPAREDHRGPGRVDPAARQRAQACPPHREGDRADPVGDDLPRRPPLVGLHPRQRAGRGPRPAHPGPARRRPRRCRRRRAPLRRPVDRADHRQPTAPAHRSSSPDPSPTRPRPDRVVAPGRQRQRDRVLEEDTTARGAEAAHRRQAEGPSAGGSTTR